MLNWSGRLIKGETAKIAVQMADFWGRGRGGGYGWLRRYLGVEKFCGVDAGAGKNRSV